MEIILYISSSEKERVDKTTHLTEIGTFSGFLRSPSSVLNPTINMQLGAPEETGLVDDDNIEVVDGDDIEVTAGLPRITDANYMYISEFGRYYFIQDITISVTGLYQITAIVDVLMSWKVNILNLNAFVERNEFEFDEYLQDESMPMYFRKRITETAPLRGNLINYRFIDAGSDEVNHTLIITTATDSFTYSSRIAPPANSGLPYIDGDEFSSKGASSSYVIDSEMFAKIAGKCLVDDTVASFIKSVVILPFKVRTQMITGSYIRVGHYDPDSPQNSLIEYASGQFASGVRLPYLSDYMVIADFVVDLPDDFTSFAPYSRYEIYIPFYGYTELNYTLVAGHRLIVYYSVNYEDGSGNVYVYDMTSKRLVFSSPCQIGQRLGISVTNAREVETAKNASNLNLALGFITSAVSIVGGVMTENPFMVAGGVTGAMSSVTSYVNTNMALFEKAVASFADSFASLYSKLDVSIRVTKMLTTISSPSDYAHAVGRPLRDTRLLSTLSGFTIAKSVHLDGVPCYSAEADKITELLALGVIL